ncbi:helix-turn-helix domain-containing protein [Methanocalculus sp.]|uniref:helix-turn-helix domain-containing protein n=1 Tax=Methanocalculus sp. TaxID=2004547 RepID=UPI0025CC6927|nr:helix-turn-helix domain-containing protein [Methanocalculus sp.]
MIISYKYRAYPDAATEAELNAALDTCRWLYNTLLEECCHAGERDPGNHARNAGTDRHAETGQSVSQRCVLKSASDSELLSLEQHRRTLADKKGKEQTGEGV